VWPPEALEFLRELEENNDSEWFRANRRRYDDHLVAPARELADKLSDLGAPHFFRPYNNLRFRPGPPLKEHLGVAIGYGGTGGYYLDLSLDGRSSRPGCGGRRRTSSSAFAPQSTTSAAAAASCVAWPRPGGEALGRLSPN
jgi:hypothetical protein